MAEPDRYTRRFVFASLGTLALSRPAMADGPPLRLVLATATPGGGFPAYGEAVAAALREVDPALTIELRNTRGSAENIPLLEAGTVDLGLVAGENAFEALSGVGRAPSPLRVVTAMYATPGIFAVKPGDPASTIADLRGRPVALGAGGSGLTIMARAFLRAAGLDPERDIVPVVLERAGDGPAMVLDGRVASLFGGGSGWPGFTTLAGSPGGIRFIGPNPAEIARLLETNPSMRPATLLAGSYPGQDRDIASAGSWSLVLARPGLDEAAGYRLARALDRAKDDLGRRLAQARETTSRNTVAAVSPGWIHPGVTRYLRETGALKD